MKKSLLFLLITVFIYSCTTKEKTVFEQWRGENREGKYEEKNLLKKWPEQGPVLIWSIEDLGEGYGSPIITENTVYVLASRDSVAVVMSLDLQGKVKWKKDYGFEWNRSYPGTRSTPTLVDDLLYVCSGAGDIACMKSENGEIIWSKNFVKDFHGQVPTFGFAQSLLINGDMVYAMPGGIDTNMVALNRFNGDLIWISKGKGEAPAYNSPKLIELENNQVIATFSKNHLLGFDAKTGRLLWSEAFKAKYPNHANTIVYDENAIFTAATIGHGVLKYNLSADGSEIKEVWKDTLIQNYFGGLIKLEDKIYMPAGGRSKDLLILNANTGEVTDSLETEGGSIIYADEMLYTYAHRSGQVCLVDPVNFEIRGRFKVKKGKKEHFSHPVIKDGVLYIRRGNALMAYNIKTK